MWGLWTAAALAVAPQPKDFSEPVLVGDEPWMVDALELSLPAGELALGPGYAFRVDLDGAPAGLVWVGEGELTAHPSPAEAERMGNWLAVAGGVPTDELTPMVRGEGWTRAVDRVLVLTRDPAVQDALRAQTPVRRGRDLAVDAEGLPVVTVTRTPGLAAARATAATDLATRVHAAAELGRDPRALLIADGARPDAGASTWVHAHGPGDLTALLEPHHADSTDDARWLTLWRDPAGTWGARPDVVAVMGWSRDERASRRELIADGPEATGALRAEARVAQVIGKVQGTDVELDFTVEASLVVRATERVAEVLLEVPRVRQRPWGAHNPQLPSQFDVAWVRDADGRELAWRFADPADADEPTTGVRVLVDLPTPLEAGDAATVRLRFADNARLRHSTIQDRGTDLGSHEELYPLGTATIPFDVMPRLVHGTDDPAPALVQAAVREDSHLELVVGGTPVDRAAPEGLRSRAAVATGERAHVAAGRWSVRETPAAAGLPAIRTALFADSAPGSRGLDTQIRAILAFLGDALPPVAAASVDVTELAALPESVAWYTPRPSFVPLPAGDALRYQPNFRGALPITGESVLPEQHFRHQWPQLEWLVVTTNLAAQAWLDASPDADWQAAAFGRAYGELFVRELTGEADADRLASSWRDCADSGVPDRRVPTPPTDLAAGPTPPTAAICYGAHAVGHALRSAAGETAWLRAVDELVRGQHGPIDSTASLGRALSATSGRDLTGLVRFWLETALPPAVDVRWRVVGSEVLVDVKSDVPFGTFELPIALAEGAAPLRVTVTDGQGAARAPLPPEPHLQVDPDGELMLHRVRVQREGQGGPVLSDGGRDSADRGLERTVASR